jgi:hypothetical protein
MQKFLEKSTIVSFILFGLITFLVICHEPPSGPADEPYIEYEIFWEDWGVTIFIVWLGTLIWSIVGGYFLKRAEK